MADKLYNINPVGQPEAETPFYMVVRIELRTTDEGAIRLVHNRPVISWPSRVVFYDAEEAQRVANKLAIQTPDFAYTVVGSIGPVNRLQSEALDEDGEDLL